VTLFESDIYFESIEILDSQKIKILISRLWEDSYVLDESLIKPEKAYLEAIRNRIWEKWDELLSIISHPGFQKYYKTLRDWEPLKTAPKWFPKDHKYIEFLRKKHITAVSYLSDKDILSKNIHENLSQRVQALKPMNDWLNTIYI